MLWGTSLSDVMGGFLLREVFWDREKKIMNKQIELNDIQSLLDFLFEALLLHLLIILIKVNRSTL